MKYIENIDTFLMLSLHVAQYTHPKYQTVSV